ncbi:MAG: ECF transporter S component [Bacteroidales bacterium]|nr:ECF transporter S component [Bacteroidales bacterium]
MEYTNTKNYQLGFADYKTYAFATAFVVGNILLPQLCHLIPKGGLIFLPIYFFTLIGAYRFGKNVGVLTAILSPVVNSVLFGMPPLAVLPAIMIKSIALALIASYVSKKYQKVTFPLIALVVVSYQLVGMFFEFAQGLYERFSVQDAFLRALQDVRIGFPGLLIQVVLGYLVIKKIYR